MQSSIRPLGAQVVLERVREEVSEGGVVIPDSARDRWTTFWDVVAVGPGRLSGAPDIATDGKDFMPRRGQARIACEVKPGDRVAMIPMAHLKGGEIMVTDEAGVRHTYLVIHEDAIVAVVT